MASTIGIIIDVVLVTILVIFGIIGFNKGFLKSLISLFSWVVCLVIAIFTAKYVASWINGIYDFSSLIGGKIAESLSSTNDFFSQTIASFESKDAILEGINNIEGLNGVLKQIIRMVFSNTNVDMTSEETVGAIAGASLGHVIMIIIAGVLVFIVLKIIVAILSRLFDNIERTKILGGLNKVFGLIFGVLKAGCVIVVLNCILVGLSLIPAVNNTITPVIQDNTHIEKFVYNQTDKIVEKYIIDGNAIQEWVNDLWNNRWYQGLKKHYLKITNRY